MGIDKMFLLRVDPFFQLSSDLEYLLSDLEKEIAREGSYVTAKVIFNVHTVIVKTHENPEDSILTIARKFGCEQVFVSDCESNWKELKKSDSGKFNNSSS